MRREPYQQIEHQGHLINVFVDESSECPRRWDNLGTMYTAHRHYCPEKELDDHFDIDEIFASRWKFREKFLSEYVALPVYMLDHSGQTVSTTPFSCPWDSGLLGIIAVPVEDVKKEYGWKLLTKKRRETIEGHLKAEIKIYDDYITGQVYFYEITMLCALLDCGRLDIQFIDKELDRFNVEAGAVVGSIREADSDRINANTFIYHIYRIALDDAIAEVEADDDLLDGDDNVSIFTNCLDSHLHIKDRDGEWREMHDYDELVAFLKVNYKTE